MQEEGTHEVIGLVEVTGQQSHGCYEAIECALINQTPMVPADVCSGPSLCALSRVAFQSPLGDRCWSVAEANGVQGVALAHTCAMAIVLL